MLHTPDTPHVLLHCLPVDFGQVPFDMSSCFLRFAMFASQAHTLNGDELHVP